MIIRAKSLDFRAFCTRSKAWGRPYENLKLNPKKELPLLTTEDGTQCATKQDSINALLKAKFPRAETHQPPMPSGSDGCGVPAPAPQITEDDVQEQLRRTSTKKAPGIDRISVIAIKALHHYHPSILPALFTACLVNGYFPKQWRHARVVFIPKPGKDPTLTDSYRPISLLSTIGKVLERLINEEITSNTQLCEQQHGFRKGIGTEIAINKVLTAFNNTARQHPLTALILLDIKGAFDHAQWPTIMSCLASSHVPQYLVRTIGSWMSERTAKCEHEEIAIERGCPQGSVLGPALWNLQYDTIIKKLAEKYLHVTVYADDTAIILAANSIGEFENEVCLAIQRTNEHLEHIGLKLNIDKTEVLVSNTLPRNQKYVNGRYVEPKFAVDGNAPIRPSRRVKYLGVYIDEKLNFRSHLTYLEEKAKKILPLLATTMRNTYGYSFYARKIMIQACIHSLFYYCSTIFYHRLKISSNARLIEGIERKANIIVTRAYRDVNGGVARIVAGSPPLAAKISERSIKWLHVHGFEIKDWAHLTKPTLNPDGGLSIANQPISEGELYKKWSEDSIQKWSAEWAENKCGEWTHQLFPTIVARIKTHLIPDFWSTQAITGHGVFKSYLRKRARTPTDRCPCGYDSESPQHVFQECLRFTSGRPPDWSSTDFYHLTYMRAVVKKLWYIENPAFQNSTTAGQEARRGPGP